MTLQKGFLKPAIIFPGYYELRFWRGIIYGFLFSVIFYFFLVTGREALRLGFHFREPGELIILQDIEIKFYDLFLAIFSLIIGHGVCFSIWLNNRPGFNLNVRNYIRCSVINNISFTAIAFTVWFIRCSSLYSLVLTEHRTDYVFNLFPDYKFFLILFLIVMFLNQWQTIIRIYKRMAFKWMSVAFLVIVSSGFLLSKIKIIDYDSLNESILKNTPEYNLKIEIPSVHLCTKLEKLSWLELVYIGYPKVGVSHSLKPVIFYKGKIVDENEFIRLLKIEKSKCFIIEQSKICILIYADKNIPLQHMDNLRMLLYRNGFYRVLIGVYPKNLKKYPKYYCLRHSSGLFREIINSWYEVTEYDSYYKNILNFGKYNSTKELMEKAINKNINLITVDKIDNDLLINGTFIPKDQIIQRLSREIKNLKNCWIEVKTSDFTTLGDYIEMADFAKMALFITRNQETKYLFDTTYKNLTEDQKFEYNFNYRRFVFRLHDEFQDLIIKEY